MLTRLRSLFSEGGRVDPAAAHAPAPGAKRFARCVLHIGTEKTGTSTIQRFLALNRKALAREGVVYPAATGKLGGSQWGFVACVHDRTWETDVGVMLGIQSAAQLADYRQGLQADLQREFAAAPQADTLLVSSEHFHSRLTSAQAIGRLRSLLETWVQDFEVVLYLRRQDRVAVSLYSTKIKSGNTSPVLFPGAPKEPPPYYFDYERIYDNWSRVFGESAMRVRLYETAELLDGDLLRDFCGTAGLALQGKKLPTPENVALDEAGAAFILELNRQLPNVVDGGRNEERDALVRLVSELSRGRNYPADRAAALAFYRRFAEGNERLKARLFPQRRAPLFDEDFSAYPETAEQLNPRYQDAVALAIRIWRAMR